MIDGAGGNSILLILPITDGKRPSIIRNSSLPKKTNKKNTLQYFKLKNQIEKSKTKKKRKRKKKKVPNIDDRWRHFHRLLANHVHRDRSQIQQRPSIFIRLEFLPEPAAVVPPAPISRPDRLRRPRRRRRPDDRPQLRPVKLPLPEEMRARYRYS